MGYSCYSLLLIVSVCWVLTPLITGDEVVSPLVIAPHCSDMCGNISIPYPFGIEQGCYFEPPNNTRLHMFKITCNHTSLTPIFGKNIEVLNISAVEGELRTKLDVSHDCYNNTGHVDSNRIRTNLATFTLSATKNILVAIGCDTFAWFTGFRGGKKYAIGCMTQCVDLQDVIDGECSGIGCCQASIPGGVNNVKMEVKSFYNHTYVYSFNPCSVAFPVAKDAFRFCTKNLSRNLDYYSNLQLPVVFNWTIGQNNCSVAKADGSCLCKANTTECYDPLHELGYRCKCKQGYSGNPYLPHGCIDIDECKSISLNSCEKPEYCTNTLGSYSCTCPKGYYGNATKDSPCSIIDRSSQSHKKLVLAIKIIIGVSGGVIVSLLAGLWFNWQHNNSKLQKIRETCFRQNGGHILRQKLLGRDVSVGNNVKMFTVEQLEKATNNYSANSIIGLGGFGMVFKGTLSSKELSLNNNQVVAIKRSIKVDSTQVEQFINEVVALSQINNKNVVKLLGCCLETEVPLLVYEYISNGTLYEHLHDEGKMSVVLSWDVRLRIAAEVADVLAYLHTTISVPIIHRDIKSANILLDENFTAKVADFGASKLVPADQEQLGTMVQGTCGYLDPEYMQTGELTDKSDVYSFGVVLVELLTREKAISYAKPETERSLAVCFLRKLKEDRLIDILDEKVVSDGAIMRQLKAVADVGRMCLKLKGEDRPTMKEVARELDGIRGMGVHPWSSNMEEETEYLLGQTHVFNDDSWNTQSRVVELGPFDDGR